MMKPPTQRRKSTATASKLVKAANAVKAANRISNKRGSSPAVLKPSSTKAKAATKVSTAETDAQQKQKRFNALIKRAGAAKGACERFSGRIDGKMAEIFASHGKSIAEQLELAPEKRQDFENIVCEQVRKELIGATKIAFEGCEAEYTAAVAGGCSKDINSAREEAEALMKKIQTLEKEEERKAKCGGKLNEKEQRKMKKLRADLAAIWSALAGWLDILEQAVAAWEQCQAESFGALLLVNIAAAPNGDEPWNEKELNAYAQVGGLVMLRAAQLVIPFKQQAEGGVEKFIEPDTLGSEFGMQVTELEEEWRSYVRAVSASEEGMQEGAEAMEAKQDGVAEYASLQLPADLRSLSWSYLETSRIGCDFSARDEGTVEVPLEQRGCVQQVEDTIKAAHQAVKTFSVHTSFLRSSLQRHAQTVVAGAMADVPAPAPATNDEADEVEASAADTAATTAAAVTAAMELSTAASAAILEKEETLISSDFSLAAAEACALCKAVARAQQLKTDCDQKFCDFMAYLSQPKKRGAESTAERLLREAAHKAELHPWEMLCTVRPKEQDGEEQEPHSLVGKWGRSECVALVEEVCNAHPFETSASMMDTVVAGMHRIDALSALAVSIKKMKVVGSVETRVSECSDLVSVVTSARSESLLSLLDDIAEADDQGEGGAGARLAKKWLSSWRDLDEDGEGAAMGEGLDSAGRAIGDELLEQKARLLQMPLDTDEQRQKQGVLRQAIEVTVQALRVVAALHALFAQAGPTGESSDLRFAQLYGMEI
jgi:hypothetical protein